MIAKILTGVVLAGVVLFGRPALAQTELPQCYAIDEAVSTLETDGWVAVDYRDSELSEGVVEVLYRNGNRFMIAAIWPQGCIMPLWFGELVEEGEDA